MKQHTRVLLIGYRGEAIDGLVAMLLSTQEAIFEPTVARSFESAIEILRTNQFDVVILLCCLPDAPPLEVFQELYPAIPETPIVMVSPTEDERIAYLALVSGAQDFLVLQQFDEKELMRSLTYACARYVYRSLQRELAMVKSKVVEVSEQMAEIRQSYTDLLQNMSELTKIIMQGRAGNAGECA